MKHYHNTVASDFNEVSRNVFEAVMILSNRARQINEQQHQAIEELREEYQESLGGSDLMLETEVEFEIPHFEKPTVMAVRDLLAGYLEYEYLDPNGPEDTKE